MPLNDDFVFQPLPPLEETIHFPFPIILNPLGPLADLAGTWGGKGFNTIWRPNSTPVSDRFLELNLTNDSIAFTAISGPIPNRGFKQGDINMFGLTYLQQVSDANLNAGLHIEPGIWAAVPATTNPAETSTIVRMASVPHGTTLLAQGTSSSGTGKPVIPANNINPVGFGPFPEQNLSNPTAFRSSGVQMTGITQGMVDNPNSVLEAALAGQTIVSFTTLNVTTKASTPITGGGVANTSFLNGAAAGPNAQTTVAESTFWIETVKGTPNFLQLQYSQTVFLEFNGISWPHVTVGTLKLNVPVTIPIWKIDPTIPKDILTKVIGPVDPAVGVTTRPVSAVEAAMSKVATPVVEPPK